MPPSEDVAVHELCPLPCDNDALISAKELPRYIGVARQTLARWRVEGFGPSYLKAGHRVLYRTGDLRTWIESRVRQNTVQQDMDKK